MKYPFKEQNVTVKGTYDLGATLTIPEGGKAQKPAIVIVPGTGTSNRDGNATKGKLNMRLYKDLSHFFSELGFVTIRYDKRGVGESKGVHIETGFDDLVDDVIANIKYLESLDFVDKTKIILCGHSEGTMLTTVANSRCQTAGLILISGAGLCLRSALVYQNYLVMMEIKAMKGFKGWLLRKAINEKNYLKQLNSLFDKVMSTDKTVIRIMGQKTPAKWMREHARYTDENMTDFITKAKCPVLAITGDKDVQANVEDVVRLKALNLPHVSCAVVPDMDHVLRTYQGEKTILNIKKQYMGELEQPLSPILYQELEKWLSQFGV